ncbi:ABC transporter permease [Cytobacillus sp. FSL W7-1323]|uniref:ABC transporter permease n=1 Tax=Cytobacillus TaxID=2675230 RepID=UPI00203B19B9|nr:ABC transporter permease [Cytobacillus kochii]MCM3322278.1 ABC transporter permease [Cytobacillus kochii]MCM3345243.1 ABC transporter permease [Cytobacillus kochii]MDM5209797.1 ABC transporter permease [Cytobacillus kochii]MDQ0188164.1 ABC-2 type transport system permease protein [Cytobacillus kochii]
MGDAKWIWALRDGLTMSKRSLMHIFRDVESLLMAIALPVSIMLLFVYVFGGAIQTGTDYVNYVVPGVIITCAGFGSSLISVSVTKDMSGGLFERFRSMPLQPSSLLVGHVVGGYLRNMIATLAVFIVALLIGFRPEAGLLEWLGVLGILTLYMISINWLFVVLGLLTKNVETAGAFTFPMLFLPYLSSAFVPTNTMPAWLDAFSKHQPMTPLIEALRGLLIGTPIDYNLWLTILWFSGLLVLSYIAATLLFRRRKNE